MKNTEPSRSDQILSLVLRAGMIGLVVMVCIGVSLFLGFASDNPNAPHGPISQAFLSLKLFTAAGIILAFTPMMLFKSKNLMVKSLLLILLLLLLQPIVVIPQALSAASAPPA